MTGRDASMRRLLVLVFLVLLFIILPFVLFGARIEQWTHDTLLTGRPAGLAIQGLCVLLLASDVILPVPSSVVSTACGAGWGLWLGGLVSTLGMSLGSVLGYALGRWAGIGNVRRWLGENETHRIGRLYARYGAWIIVILRPVPVLAEASTIFAGLSRMPWVPYLTLSCVANAIISLFYAGAGTLLRHSSPAAAFGLLILMLAVAAALWSIARRRAASPGTVTE